MAATNPPATSNDAQRLRVIASGICALVLTVGLARFAYTPLLPLMRSQAGLSDLAAGWLATLNYAGYMTGALLGASINDLRLKFRLYRAGLVIAVLATAAMGLTDHWLAWALLRFLAGLSSAAGMLLASGLILNWLMRHGCRPELGLHFTGLGLGIAVSGLAVSALVTWWPWQQVWLGLGMLGLTFLLPAWRWLPAPVAAPVAPSAAGAAPHRAAPSPRWMWLFIGAYFCAGFGFVVGATFIVAILERLPALAGRGAWVWVIVGAVATPSCFVWDRVAASVGHVRALLLAFGLQTLSIVLPALSGLVALNLLAALLFGGTFVGIVSLTLTLFGSHFPSNPGKAMSRMTLGYGVAQIGAPAMTGYIATTTGSYRGALVVTTAVLCVGMCLLLAILREERRTRSRTER